VQLALVGRYYERIADHAVNIGERVRYMVTGWLPEHTGVARLAAQERGDIPFEAEDGGPADGTEAPENGHA
jgi:phosphate transport system protein